MSELTWEEFERFRRAVNESRRLVPWLRVAGYIRGGDPDELRSRSADHPLGLPPTWIAAQEISDLLQEINQWGELEDVARFGYEFARQLTREVETAAYRWPYEDKPHQMAYLRCGWCERMSLKWHPPRDRNQLAAVRCFDRECGYTLTEEEFAGAVATIREKALERQLGKPGGGREHGGPVETDDLAVGA